MSLCIKFPSFRAQHTVEFIFQSSSGAQLHPFTLLSRQKRLEDQAQKIIAEYIPCHFEAGKAQDSVFWPSRLFFELGNCKFRRMEGRWHRTARNIIAKEGCQVTDQWKTKRSGESSDSIRVYMLAERAGKKSKIIHTDRQTRSHEKAQTAEQISAHF